MEWQANRSARKLPSSGRLLAVDPGAKRIGIALSDPSQTLAQPLATLSRRAGQRFPLRDLRTLLQEHSPVGILVGLPLAPDGSEDERAAAARELGSLLEDKTGLPVEFWDERLSTARVHSDVRASGGRIRTGRQEVDQLAATVLLQSFLDSRS